jgi:hypothetical protein
MVAISAPTLAGTYKALCQALNGQQKLTMMASNHIAAKHGIHGIAAFNNSDAVTEHDKLVTYGEIAKVMLGKAQPSSLQGQVANGQAVAKEEKKFEPADLTKDRGAVIPLPSVGTNDNHEDDDEDRIRTVMPPDDPPKGIDMSGRVHHPNAPTAWEKRQTPEQLKAAQAMLDPRVDQLREVLMKVMGPQEATLDEAKVNAIVSAQLAEREDAITSNVTSIVDKAMAEALAAIKPSVIQHEIKIGEEIRAVTGAMHRQLTQIVAWMRAGVPVWLWGPAGGGKTHLSRQVAEALGQPFYCAPIDETITVGKLVGFRNVSNGEFVEGLMYRAFKQGGVQLMDEIDTNSTAIAAINSMSANGHYTFPNGEEVARSPNWYLIAGANSKGTGACAGYVARVRMDAATLNRFAIIKLEYDPGLELELSCGIPNTSVPWKPVEPADESKCRAYVEWVQRVRSKVGDSVLISPRASYLGVKALRAGIPVVEVADALVFALVTDDTRRRICTEAGAPDSI